MNRRLLPAVIALGAVLRIMHNAALMASPLYVVPIGGHRVFLETARLIAGGELLPGNRPFTENSPLLPYLYACFTYVVGENLLVWRLLGIAADSGTIALVAVLGSRLFDRRAGLFAALIYACYGPAVLFSTELIYIPFVMPLVTGGLVLLTGEKPRCLLAGVLFGAGALLMPTLLLIAPLAALWAFTVYRPRAGCAVLLGAFTGVVPATVANYLASGEVVLLTTSAGHNFFLGHNPLAQPGYSLPASVDGQTMLGRGSTFDELKTLAERHEGRALRDTEVSGYYFRRAWASMRADPQREVALALRRTAAFFNVYEPLTYTNYRYESDYSPVLNALPRFPLLFALAAAAIVLVPLGGRSALLLPVLTGLATCLVFFMLARFRELAVPSFVVLGGAACSALCVRPPSGSWGRVLGAAAVASAAWYAASLPMAFDDSSNEWNKEGGVLLKLHRLEDAETAFRKAMAANDRNPSSYLNLAKLYEVRNDPEHARAMQSEGEKRLRDGAAPEFLGE